MRRFVSVVLISILVLGGFCFLSDVDAAEKVLVFGRKSGYLMEPAVACGDEEIETINVVYDTLTTLDNNLKIQPLLATSWEVSDDYKTYTFHLRKGVKFHDGTPFNAEAVKFSFNRLHHIGKTCIGAWESISDLNSIEVIDEYTVRFNLKEPYPAFISADLVNGVYSVMSPTYVKKHATSDDPYAEKWMVDHECGSGPWKLVEWVKDQKVVFEKNKDYFGGVDPPSDKETPRADKLIFRIYKDSTTARLWLERGDIDFVEKLSPDDFKALEKSQNVIVYKAKYPKVAYLTFDVSKPPYNDINVRKAMAYAIKYPEMIEYVEKGNASPAYGMHPEGILGFNPKRFSYHYDLAKAKEFMAKSSYPKGFTANLLYSPERRGSFQVGSIYIQNYLKAIGINLKIQPLALATMLDTMAKGDYGITLKVWSAGLPDPDEMGGWFYDQPRDDSGWVACFWDNKEAQKAMRLARTLPSGPEREKLYNDTDEMAMREAIYIPLYQTMNLIAIRNNIKGFVWKPYVWTRFGSIDKQ